MNNDKDADSMNSTESSITTEEFSAKKTLTVKDWAPEDRPREKMIAQGKKSLTNAELIGILLGSGNTEQSAVALAQEVLFSCGNSLSSLSRREIKDLMKMHKGIGEAKAVSILAALELGYRMLAERMDNAIILNDPVKTFHYISPLIINLPHEEFWAIYLNNKTKVVARQRISSGGLTSTTVDLRMIFKAAFENNATSLIVCHNHPSCSNEPSTQDKILTQKLSDAGRILDIQLLDHVIVSLDSNNEPQYYSFAEENIMQ